MHGPDTCRVLICLQPDRMRSACATAATLLQSMYMLCRLVAAVRKLEKPGLKQASSRILMVTSMLAQPLRSVEVVAMRENGGASPMKSTGRSAKIFLTTRASFWQTHDTCTCVQLESGQAHTVP